MIFILIAVSIFTLDFVLKKYVEAKMEQGEEHSLAGGKILIHKFHNNGLAFGKFSEHSKLIEHGTLAVLAMTGVYFVWLLFHPGQILKKTGIGMVLGGGACNWFDRFHQGFVTDYFSFSSKWEKLRRIVFNLSDMFIFAGSILYLFGSLFKTRKLNK